MYASPAAAGGELDCEGFVQYAKAYLQYGHLNRYDLEHIGPLFYYQLLVCDYYGQYYASLTANREIYRRQAELSTRWIHWLAANMPRFTEACRKIL